MSDKELTLNEKVERAIVLALIDEATKAGFPPDSVWDGGEYVDVAGKGPEAVIEAVFAVDEATVHFGPGLENRGVFLVCGNGTDIISDWHCGVVDFDKAVKAACERAENITVTA